MSRRGSNAGNKVPRLIAAAQRAWGRAAVTETCLTSIMNLSGKSAGGTSTRKQWKYDDKISNNQELMLIMGGAAPVRRAPLALPRPF